MSETSFEVWKYDQLQPDDIIRSGYKAPRKLKAWAEPFPPHLIKNSPEEIDQVEKDRRQEEYLAKHNVK